MSVNIKRADGTLQKIAGHTIILDANASEIRQGTWSISMPATPSLYQTTVTFTDPMPDTDYAVILEMSDYTYGGTVNVQLMVFDKTVTGFKIKTHISPTSAGAISGVYTAFKPIKLDGYTELQNKVNNPDAVPTENSTNLVKSGGVWEAIKNASAVWKGTQAEWNALPVADKQTYDLAVLTDAGYILAVDRTDGSSVETANLNKIWRGTQAEWDALTPAEKDEWEEAQIIDHPVETSILEKIYSVGALYFNTADVDPAEIFGFGTWERVAKNMTLWGATTDGQGGTTKEAGLPNITGLIDSSGLISEGPGGGPAVNGAFYASNEQRQSNSKLNGRCWNSVYMDASRSSPVYGKSTTVQPPAFVVNIWCRTA